METLKLKKATMWAVKIFTLQLYVILAFTCSSSKVLTSGNDRFEAHRFKSENGGSYITLGVYHYEDKSERAPAVFYINNVIYKPEKYFVDKTFSVLPGQFNINVRLIHKEDTEIKGLQVQKGDSIYLEVYLMDDPEPLRD